MSSRQRPSFGNLLIGAIKVQLEQIVSFKWTWSSTKIGSFGRVLIGAIKAQLQQLSLALKRIIEAAKVKF